MKRDAVASSWLIRRSIAEGSRLIVQGTSHARSYQHGDGPIAVLARRGTVATYRSPAGPGATYAANPDPRLLAASMLTADGRSIVATEDPSFPLHGWAMATGATNLATNEVTKDERSPQQITLLDHLVRMLYNGWSHKEVGRRATAYCLPKLVASGMTYPVFVGSLVAMTPRHLDSNSSIAAMRTALPAAWESERKALSGRWFGP